MIAAAGVLTSRGGKTSHAAVVARGHGQDLRVRRRGAGVDAANRRDRAATDWSRGRHASRSTAAPARCYLGEVPVAPSPVVEYFEGDLDPAAEDATELVARRAPADEPRRRAAAAAACAPTPTPREDAARARRFGAQGIGLCRTEHMFLGERRALVERLILADDRRRAGGGAGRAAAAAARRLRRDLRRDGRAARHHPAARPAAARVPARPHRAVGARSRSAEARRGRRQGRCGCSRPCAGCTRRTRCSGCAACGSVSRPGAVRDAGPRDRRGGGRASAAGGDLRPEIMVPLVGPVRELRRCADEADAVLADEVAARGRRAERPIGTMIELPRAALTAGQIAEAAEFFSFGTNDLTQMTLGLLPRRRRGARSSPAYLEPGSSGSRRSRRSTATASAGWSRIAVQRGPGGAAGPGARRLRRARRRPRVGALLPRGRAGLRVLLAVPGAGRPPGGGPRGGRGREGGAGTA